MRKDTERFNSDMPLQPVEVFLVDGTSFIGVQLAVLPGEGRIYQVDSGELQRGVPDECIAYTRSADIPSVQQTRLEKAGAGMLGKHHRVLYRVLVEGEVRGDVWVTAMGDFGVTPTTGSLETILRRVWDGVVASPCAQEEAQPQGQQSQQSRPPGRGVRLRVPAELWLDTLHLLDVNHVAYALDPGQTRITQVCFEKFDRRSEQFRVHQKTEDELGLEDLSDPTTVGPAWRSQKRKFFRGEIPGAGREACPFTWEQTARVFFDVKLVHHKSILPVLNKPLVLPKPLSAYFQQRVRKAMAAPGEEDPKLPPDAYTHSQPQLSRSQLDQMYMASYWVHRFERGTRLPLEPQDRRTIEAARVVLMCYKMRGFFPRETRNYNQTGANSCIYHNAGRRWKQPLLRALYDRDQGGEGMVKLDGDRVNTNELPYRGKFDKRQPPDRAIYRPHNKRRNVDLADNDVQKVEDARRQRMEGGALVVDLLFFFNGGGGGGGARATGHARSTDRPRSLVHLGAYDAPYLYT
jgi:hypothetical protein